MRPGTLSGSWSSPRRAGRQDVINYQVSRHSRSHLSLGLSPQIRPALLAILVCSGVAAGQEEVGDVS